MDTGYPLYFVHNLEFYFVSYFIREFRNADNLQSEKRGRIRTMWSAINNFLGAVDNFVWGVPLMVLILSGGLLLTVRLGLLQIRKLPLAVRPWRLHDT